MGLLALLWAGKEGEVDAVMIDDTVTAHRVKLWRYFYSLGLVVAKGTNRLLFCGCEVYRCPMI